MKPPESRDDICEKDWLLDEIERLTACLNSRDDFLGSIGQWQAYVDSLPSARRALEQKP